MLIYNHKFEFIGIDEKDLNKLGFKNFTQLQAQCDDFADLFIKKPSYIHNFKNFKWILYILNSNSDEAKAMISIQDKIFTTNLEINTIYLAQDPAQEAYIISLKGLRQIDGVPTNEIQTHQLKQNKPQFTPPVENELSLQEDSKQINTTAHDIEANTKDIQPKVDDLPLFGDYVNPEIRDTHDGMKNYIYDPKIAAKELGLPVDLIEEFIGDFIQQAYEFKDDLYISFQNHDFEKVKNLSHKLKGVSANLRIEDAFKALNIINTSHDNQEIKDNLDTFYKIIYKLKNKKELTDTTTKELPNKQDDDLYTNLLKDHDDTDISLQKSIKKQQEVNVSKQPKDNTTLPSQKSITTPVSLHYDKQKVINELSLSEDIVNALLNDFKKQSSIVIEQMRSATKIDDFKQVEKLALNIKGISDNLRLTQISSLLQMLISTDTNQKSKKDIEILWQYISQL